MTTSAPQDIDIERLDPILENYPQERRSLVMVLQDVQNTYGFLPKEVLVKVAGALDVPKAHVFHVATYYKAFSLTPRGRHTWTVCLGTACHVRGAKLLTEHLERSLGINAGETTEDLEYTLETVNCVGACALGPLAIIDGKYLGSATTTTIDKSLKKLKKSKSKEKPDGGGE